MKRQETAETTKTGTEEIRIREGSMKGYLDFIVDDLNNLSKEDNIKYATNIEVYKTDFKASIIIAKSQSVVMRPGAIAIAVDSSVTEEQSKILFWTRKSHKMHLKIKIHLDKLPGLGIETIRALFKLYKYKLVGYVRQFEIKDATSSVEFTFI